MSRDEILKDLETRSWYQASDSAIKAKLMALPPLFDGFLADLAQRPDTVGGLTQLEIVEVLPGSFAVIIKIKVTQADKTYTYEYMSWNRGPESGAKGIVFIRTGEEITHFVVLRGPKFAPGFDVYDMVGGFAEVDEVGVAKLLERFGTELKEELGMPDLVVSEVRELGRIMPDAGMTNNHPLLFAAIIDASQAENIGRLPNPDPFEVTAVGPVIFPLSALANLVTANDDAYFHVLVTRSISIGLIPASLLG